MLDVDLVCQLQKTYQCADDASLGMESFPAMIAIPGQAHAFNSALAALTFVDPNRRSTFPGRIKISINAYAFDRPLGGLAEDDMAKVMLLPLDKPERFLKLCDSLL